MTIIILLCGLRHRDVRFDPFSLKNIIDSATCPCLIPKEGGGFTKHFCTENAQSFREDFATQ